MSEAKTTSRRRLGRQTRARARLAATSTRPQFLVVRSNKHIYAQVIDHSGKVLAQASDIKSADKAPMESAKVVGVDLAKRAIEKNVKEVTFNRRGYKYHGRVKALADAAREAGLEF